MKQSEHDLKRIHANQECVSETQEITTRGHFCHIEHEVGEVS